MAAWSKDVGEYRIEELIGYGGCGEVWRARHRDTGESVALKWLRGGGPELRERQLREASLLAAVNHPHLGRLREVLLDRGDPVLVLDHHAGGSLAALLARRRRLRPGEVVSVISPVAAALAYAHDEGLVHADVTPGNVLFTAAGRPVLTDLGVARVLGEDADLHATPEYVDPQVARGGAPTAASDVFGLAAVAFHALAGIPPWNASGAEATMAVAADGVLPDLRRLAPDAPKELLETVLRALSAEPELRGTAAEFALDVRHACEPEAVAFAVDARGAPRPPSRTGPVTQGVRSPR
ncbi:MAG: serine/threonine protein kinase, partial [Geodermatophilaceae bacterium]|nr:serine/threonine protein kinase [Geodermatophilaceae bacterium]